MNESVKKNEEDEKGVKKEVDEVSNDGYSSISHKRVYSFAGYLVWKYLGTDFRIQALDKGKDSLVISFHWPYMYFLYKKWNLLYFHI